MNNLFWKIFLSFWVSLVLFASLTLWSTSHYLDKVRAMTEQSQPRQKLLFYLSQAEDIAGHGGLNGLRKWLQQIDRSEAVPYLLVDENGLDLLGREVPPRLSERIHRYERRYGHEEQEHEREYRRPHHRPVFVDGKRYRLVADFQHITLGRVLNRPRIIAVPVFIALLISGSVCFLLVRYITAPINKLRGATHKMASGDLSQRVSPSLGKRQDEIVDLANDFDHMAQQLEVLVNSHKQLLRDASHELRSPLARLQVALELARQNPSGNAAELDRIERESERLNELIGQLLSLARMETGSVEIPRHMIELDDLVESIVADAAFEAHAMQRDIRIIDSIPVKLEANETLLHSALENIIRNALRYTEQNSCIEVSLQPHPLKDNQVTLRIRDYGPGIPVDMLERIFEPFVRISEARERTSGGYGLGLAIAARAIHLHGGDIRAQNEPDKGMSILVNLPVKNSL